MSTHLLSLTATEAHRIAGTLTVAAKAGTSASLTVAHVNLGEVFNVLASDGHRIAGTSTRYETRRPDEPPCGGLFDAGKLRQGLKEGRVIEATVTGRQLTHLRIGGYSLDRSEGSIWVGTRALLSDLGPKTHMAKRWGDARLTDDPDLGAMSTFDNEYGYNAGYLADIGAAISSHKIDRDLPLRLYGNTDTVPLTFHWWTGTQAGFHSMMPIKI